MSEVIIFVILLAFVFGGIHCYHSYIFAPEIKHLEERIRKTKRIRDELKLEISEVRKMIIHLMRQQGVAPAFMDYGAVANEAEDLDNDDDEVDEKASDPLGGADLWAEVDRMKEKAKERLIDGNKQGAASMVVTDPEIRRENLRRVLPASALGPRFPRLRNERGLSQALGSDDHPVGEPVEESPRQVEV